MIACATHEEAVSTGPCSRCRQALCDACVRLLDGGRYCASCVDELKAMLNPAAAPTVQAPVLGQPASMPMPRAIVPDSGTSSLGKALAFGAGAGLLGALLWFGVVLATDMKIGLIAVGVGWAVGRACLLGAGGEGSSTLAWGSLAIGLGAILLGDYLIINHAWHSVLSTKFPGVALPTFVPMDAFLQIFIKSFQPLDVLFYGIGAWEAFKLPNRAKAA